MSKFIDDLLDFETYVPKLGGKWPSLKLVFDNLRCYPILAIYALALRLLVKAPDIWSTIAFWFLIPIFIFLGLACLVQTAVLLSVLVVGISSIYLQPGVKAPQVLQQYEGVMVKIAIALVVCLLAVGFIAAANLLGALARMSPGA